MRDAVHPSNTTTRVAPQAMGLSSREVIYTIAWTAPYVANKSVFLTYIASKDNLADLFTKALHAYKLKRFAIIRGTDEHLDR